MPRNLASGRVTPTGRVLNSARNAVSSRVFTPPSVLESVPVVGFWKFSGDGSDAVDGNNLTGTNSPTFATGPRGDTNGATQIVLATSQIWSIPSNDALLTGTVDFLVGGHFYLDTTASIQVLISKWATTTPDKEFELFYNNGSNRFLFNIANRDTVTASAFGAVTTGTWNQILAWYNSVAGTLSICVNDGTVNSISTTGGGLFGQGALTIGGLGGGTSFRMNGRAARCFIAIGIGSVPSQAVRDALWNNGNGPDTLYAVSHFIPNPANFDPPDIFAIAGQSSASGRGTSSQRYTGANSVRMFGNDYVLKTIKDPVDSGVGQVDTVSDDTALGVGGSMYPLIANAFVVGNTRAAIFLPCALGATSITQWQPGANHQDRATLYGSMIYRALQMQSLGTLRCVIWWQGETDADAAMSQATYSGYLVTLANAVFADLGIKLMPCKLQTFTHATQANQDKINAAIGANWGIGNVLTGPDLTGITADDAYHLTSNANLASAATLWWNALKAAFGW